MFRLLKRLFSNKETKRTLALSELKTLLTKAGFIINPTDWDDAVVKLGGEVCVLMKDPFGEFHEEKSADEIKSIADTVAKRFGLVSIGSPRWIENGVCVIACGFRH